ncbi:MAG: DinB family protein [Bacteroidetes bacterium]|nr:DinB family protein [Bacteroidota bacterium]
MNTALIGRYHLHIKQVQTLLETLQDYDDATLNKQPAPGSWSAAQTVQHLLKSETGVLAYCRKKMQFESNFKKAGIFSRIRVGLLGIMLWAPIKFKAPKVIDTENLPEFSRLDDLKAEWAKTHKNWLDFLEELPEKMADKAVFKHPRAGRINWKQTFLFFQWHTKRHAAQIRRAIVAAGK